jgi:hypothetical protein
VASPTGHWLNVRLTGDTAKKTPKDATGSIAYLTTGKLRQRLDVISGAVYCSQNDPTLHFGLGTATRADRLEVQWANGATEFFGVPAIDKTMTIVQGKGAMK